MMVAFKEPMHSGPDPIVLFQRLAQLEREIEYYGEETHFLVARAELLLAMHLPDKAIEAIDQVIALDPTDKDALYVHALASVLAASIAAGYSENGEPGLPNRNVMSNLRSAESDLSWFSADDEEAFGLYLLARSALAGEMDCLADVSAYID